ncbi:sporulation protein YunB [Pumilibacter muris]|uniref:sporulation protein YunB n=1 Tax=Pumilibacter muris TaxID=2941510 RepID=UPI00203F247E|nr:sporulation protein YunB [Pumilibacter muris]
MARCPYYKKRRKKRKKRILLLTLLFLIAAIYAFTAIFIRPVIRTVSREAIKSLTVDIVNVSVAEVMNSNPAFLQLTEVIKDNAGNIALIQTNSAAVNMLARNVTENAQNNLNSIGDSGVKIPLGSLSGISFLAGRGPDINIKAVQVGNIDTDFSSQFLPAGINQTIHKFFIDVTASVNIIIPGAENKVTTVTKVLIGESIIIGKVPDVYFGNQASDLLFNLVP